MTYSFVAPILVISVSLGISFPFGRALSDAWIILDFDFLVGRSLSRFDTDDWAFAPVDIALDWVSEACCGISEAVFNVVDRLIWFIRGISPEETSSFTVEWLSDGWSTSGRGTTDGEECLLSPTWELNGSVGVSNSSFILFFLFRRRCCCLVCMNPSSWPLSSVFEGETSNSEGCVCGWSSSSEWILEARGGDFDFAVVADVVKSVGREGFLLLLLDNWRSLVEETLVLNERLRSDRWSRDFSEDGGTEWGDVEWGRGAETIAFQDDAELRTKKNALTAVQTNVSFNRRHTCQ